MEPIAERKHFGAGDLATTPATSVFINCPFDDEYAPLFDAIVLAAACCGFFPRSALESGNIAESRMNRITRAIFSSKYSIHDLSRCGGQGAANLARFNMPLELGIAMARRFMGESSGYEHDWLVLVPQGHEYVGFISDMAGYDPKTHDGKPETAIPAVVAWLATRPDAIRVPTPKQIIAALPRFSAELVKLREEWRGELPWADRVLAALGVAKTL